MCAISKVVPWGFCTPRMSEHTGTCWFLVEERGLELKPWSVERRERTEKRRGRNSVVACQAAFTSARLFVSVSMCVRLIRSEEKGGSMIVKLFCVDVCYRFRVCSAGCDDLWSWYSVYCVLCGTQRNVDQTNWGLLLAFTLASYARMI